jgi:hypothetical protein
MRFLAACCAALLALPVRAQTPGAPPADTTDYARRYAATITAADLERHLRVLASDEYEGRETGKKGQQMAAEYLAKQFTADGVAGPVAGDKPYYQRFELTRTSRTDLRLDFGKRRLTYLQDYYPVGSAQMLKTAKLRTVFVGYGIEENNHSDYATDVQGRPLDVRGCAVVMWQGEPTDERGISQLTGNSTRSTWTTDVNRKLTLARQKGAVAAAEIPRVDDPRRAAPARSPRRLRGSA